METKLSNLLIILFLSSCTFSHSQIKYSMTDVSINDVQMSNPSYDYSVPLKCKIVKDSLYYDDESEINIRNLVYSGDRIDIYCNARQDYTDIFTYYIEIKSSKHKVGLKEKDFFVGMTINEINKLLPEIYRDYNDYKSKNSNNVNTPVYIGIPLIIKNNSNNYSCQGLKFQILNDKIISMLVDFRSDGDFN